MGNYTIFQMFENPRRGRQARSFTTNVSKILDLKSSSEHIFFRKLSLGAPANSTFLSSSMIIGRVRKISELNPIQELESLYKQCATSLYTSIRCCANTLDLLKDLPVFKSNKTLWELTLWRRGCELTVNAEKQ